MKLENNWSRLIVILLCFIVTMSIIGEVSNYLEEKNKSLYEHCLDKCGSNFFRAENNLKCLGSCNNAFKEVTLDFMNKAESILNKVLEEKQKECGEPKMIINKQEVTKNDI